MARRTYKVKEVAQLSGVTVRTLHHYDAIGLLSPPRTPSGYRVYSEPDLLRLQQILVYRELGLPLERISSILSDPKLDPKETLLEQRARLHARAEHTHAMIRAVDAALRALQGDDVMNARELFDGFDPRQYEAEVEERWGNTEAYRQSTQRTQGYSKEDWARIKAQSDELLRRIAAQVQAGTAPTSEAAMDLAEEHRRQIDRFYYSCSHAMHRNLAQLYQADARFEQNLDRHGEGVAAFLSAAIEANCERAGR